jgi:hypothetical protein
MINKITKMKKIIPFILLYLYTFIPFTASSQYIGIQGGLSMSNVLTNQDFFYGLRYIPAIMLYVQTTPNRVWSINTGLGYNLRGFTSNAPNDEFFSQYNEKSGKYFTNIHNLMIPLTCSYRVNIVKDKFALLPAAGFFGAVVFVKSAEYHVPENEFDSGYKDLVRGDFGLRADIALEIFRKFHLGFNYDYGFLNLSKQENVRWNSSSFDFYLRFMF